MNREILISRDATCPGQFLLYVTERGPNLNSMVLDFGMMAWQEVQVNKSATARPLLIAKGALQDMMDDLYRQGFRPSIGVGEPAHVEALHEHIDDLRLFVKKLLKIEEPK